MRKVHLDTNVNFWFPFDDWSVFYYLFFLSLSVGHKQSVVPPRMFAVTSSNSNLFPNLKNFVLSHFAPDPFLFVPAFISVVVKLRIRRHFQNILSRWPNLLSIHMIALPLSVVMLQRYKTQPNDVIRHMLTQNQSEEKKLLLNHILQRFIAVIKKVN